ncbi:MAG: MBL fold metallo-hydrolase [Clostridia bacterium]|nr:MBL fold metallo-hydrolase [Clostridia bacterium]
MKIKKILLSAVILIMAALLVFGMVSCSKDGDETEQTTATSATTQPPSGDEAPPAVETLKLIENGTVKVKAVYQSDSEIYTDILLDILKSTFENKYDAEITATKDSEHTRDDDGIEILIGKTKYEASTTYLNALEDNSYSITVKGNKIVVSTNHPALFPTAIHKLLDSLTFEDGTLSIEKDFSFSSGTVDHASISDDGETTDYTIVYDADSAEALAAATRLKEEFTRLGIEIDVMDDSSSSAGPEILIGNTNRDLSGDSEAYYRKAYLDVDSEGDVAITGHLESGVLVFAQNINSLKNEMGEIVVVAPMFGLTEPIGMGTLPLYEGGGEVEVTDSFGPSKSYYLTIHGASKGDFEDYTDTLADHGYTRYSTKTLNGNIFETWTDGYSILTMAHISYLDPATTDSPQASASLGNVRYISIAVDCVENSPLPPVETDIAKTTTVQLTTIGTGCGYLLRLSDGRFIVFDGGMPVAAESIYNMVTEQNTREGKPVIAAWFITHFHIDHVGAANDFIQNYSEQVDIQTFVHNLPGDEVYIDKNTAEGTPNNEDVNMRARGVTFYERIAEFYPDAKIIVAHAGQRFEYGDIDIDILWTAENSYKKSMVDTNQSSVLYSITGNSGRMIILGDQQERGCAILDAMYGSTLKCDLVQVSHHGYNGGDEAMYASMDADYAIWSASKEAIISGNRHIQSINKRNLFDYKTVEYNLAPKNSGPAIILYEGMTKAELAELDIGLEG